jgi:hypothetical protein
MSGIRDTAPGKAGELRPVAAADTSRGPLGAVEARAPRSPHPVARSVCDLCAREAGGLLVQLKYPDGPVYHACSAMCVHTIVHLVSKGKGQIPMLAITDMERKAVEDARATLWNSMVEWIGEERAMEIFGALNEGQIDGAIFAIWTALQVSMQQQSARGGIPF